MRVIGGCGLAVAAVALVLVGGAQATAAPIPVLSPAGIYPSNFVVASAGGNDFQIESAMTGDVVKNIGAIAGYTNNGLALSPDGRDLYATVNRNRSVVIERITLATGGETPFADGEEPSISGNGQLLAYGTGSVGSEELVVRDLRSGRTRSIDLQRLLGRQADLLDAAITWVGSRIVVLPGGVAMTGGSLPIPTRKSCSAVPFSATCLIVVRVGNGLALTAKRVVLSGVRAGVGVIGSAGPSHLVLAGLDGRRTAVYRVDIAAGVPTARRLFLLPSDLPLAFDAEGTALLYLVGHGPVALWVGNVSAHRLGHPRKLNANMNPAGIAW